MDRVDLFITVPAIKYEKLAKGAFDEAHSSQNIALQVQNAREIQRRRFAEGRISTNAEMGIVEIPPLRGGRISTNAEMGIVEIKKYCHVDSKSETLLKNYVDAGKLSARGYHRVLKVARTIADLDGSEQILFDHVAEALMYRPSGALV